jgi:phosphotransferase system, enzyme I, PtsP
MADSNESDSRKLRCRLRDTLGTAGQIQERLDRITDLIADSMRTEVCSIYLFRDEDTLELCATEGVKKNSVHKTRFPVCRKHPDCPTCPSLHRRFFTGHASAGLTRHA